MQKLNVSNQEIDLGGHKVFVGSRVNVRWKGDWYAGRVLKLGPKRNLCRIRDLSSKQTLLLEPQQIKFTEANGLERRFLPGNHVAYNNGDKWLAGEIVTASAVGLVQVSWRKSVRAAEAQNWFEIVDVAPNIRDESNIEQSKEELAASKSGLLPNDAVEPHPRTMENALFDPNNDEEENTDITDHFFRARHSAKHHNMTTNGFPMSPTYEDIDEEILRANRSKARPLPSLPVDQLTESLADPWMSEMGFSPTHSIPPPALSTVYSHVTPYGSAAWEVGASPAHQHHPVHSFHIPHPKPASDRNLERSTLPCALSYQLNYQNGIPPHHSSNFFKQMKRTVALPTQMSRGPQASDSDIYGHSLMRTSPSILSRAMSEPLSSTLQVIPPRERKRNRLFSWKKKQSKKTKKQKGQPLPYEVPRRILEVVAEDESTKEDLTEMESETTPRPQTSTPKKKSPGAPPVIASASSSLVSVNMGENILITCTANSKAPLTYEWYKDGVKLRGTAGRIEQLSPGKLEIQKAQQEDGGMYRCVVKNKYGSETRYFQLNVTMEYRVPMKVVRRSPHRTKHSKKAKPKPEPEEPIAIPEPISIPGEDISMQREPIPIPEPISIPGEDISMQREPIPIPEPISIPGEDVEVKKFLDDLVEDIKIPDIEFSIGKPENEEDAMEFETEDVPDNQANDQEATEINPIEDGDQLMDIPKIAGAPERKIKALRRISIGNKAEGEMDLYLGGYGEDYGSRSSTTDLEQEGLRYYREREIKRSLAARDKEKEKQSKGNSPTKDEESAPVSFKHKSKKLFNFSKFTRKKKITQVADQAAELQPQEFTPTKKPKPVATVLPQIVVETVHVNGEKDSIAVNTSLGGTDSDDTVVDELAAGKGHVHLPLESVPVSDRVRLLQESVKEHHPDDIIAEANRRKGFFSGIFSKGKNTAKTSV